MQQSTAFARTLTALGTDVQFVETSSGPGRVLIQTRKLPLIGSVHLITRAFGTADKAALMSGLRGLDLRGAVIVNTAAPHPRPPGYVRLAKPRDIALLPLGPEPTMRAALHQKWRNTLRRTEHTGLTCDICTYDAEKHAWFITAERAQQKARGYRNWPLVFLSAFAAQNPGQAVVVTAHKDRHPIAAMLILCHPPWATYHIGFTTPEGRQSAAHTAILWQAMIWLADRGFTMLDLGSLTGPPGLDRFKCRSGAMPQRLGGTWLRLPFKRGMSSVQ
ncbi:GNAT family N-acetyltransferase [Marivita sp. S0852]|uniref:GNAT family N-acetyltransferase n=1 Tax=Marivita sp. S0852 TaxID=3373893 RepID=UPI003981DB23